MRQYFKKGFHKNNELRSQRLTKITIQGSSFPLVSTYKPQEYFPIMVQRYKACLLLLAVFCVHNI